jgi:hypothetical protein
MYNIQILVAAAAVTVAMGVSGASAAPWDHRAVVIRHEHRPLVMRERVFDTLRVHHYRGIAAPIFIRGHYVVRSHDRFGRVVLVEVNPYTGAFIGEFRA